MEQSAASTVGQINEYSIYSMSDRCSVTGGSPAAGQFFLVFDFSDLIFDRFLGSRKD